MVYPPQEEVRKRHRFLRAYGGFAHVPPLVLRHFTGVSAHDTGDAREPVPPQNLYGLWQSLAPLRAPDVSREGDFEFSGAAVLGNHVKTCFSSSDNNPGKPGCSLRGFRSVLCF